MDIADPVIWRGIERIIIVLSSGLFGFMGYRLYLNGISGEKNKLNVSSPFLKFALSGTGPGLFFMSFGALVLLGSVFWGGAKKTVTEERIEELDNKIEKIITSVSHELKNFTQPPINTQKLASMESSIERVKVELDNVRGFYYSNTDLKEIRSKINRLDEIATQLTAWEPFVAKKHFTRESIENEGCSINTSRKFVLLCPNRDEFLRGLYEGPGSSGLKIICCPVKPDKEN